MVSDGIILYKCGFMGDISFLHQRIHFGKGGSIRCPAGWALTLDWSRQLEDFDLWFVWAGKGRVVMADGAVIPLQRGTVLWMRPGGVYIADQDPADHLGVAYQHFRIPSLSVEELGLIPEQVQLSDVVFFEQVFKRVISLVNGHRLRLPGARRGHLDSARPLFHVLLAEYISPPLRSVGRHPAEAKIRRQMERILESPGALPSVAAMAAEAGYQRDHYRKIFRQLSGLSPKEWLLTVRIDSACDLLMETPMSVSEIADRLGYEDVYHFSKQFKLRTGTSPSGYRRGGRRGHAAG